jgi:transcriptional regulator with GAF, ATPase, and Fis domain
MTSTRRKQVPAAVAPKEATERKKSKLSQRGDEAKRKAMREYLLESLQANDWNLSQTARSLEMGDGATPVITAIRNLGLEKQYEAARKRGDIAPGRPT